MEDNVFDRISEVDMQKTMESYYIDYAMSVIASRALPDVRDGLKPVQRSSVIRWVNIILTVTVPFTAHLLPWLRNGI